MDLLHIKTGTVLNIGDAVTTFRGEKAVLTHCTPPHKPSSTGRVCIKGDGWEAEYFPSVIGAAFVDGWERL